MNGIELLGEFRKTRAEGAFGELVKRYTNLVYSTAKRRLSDASLIQDAVQTVFIRLAKAMPNVRSEAELAAWLHRTTVHVSIDLWRSEDRRRTREQHAVSMQPDNTEHTAWKDIAPLLDEALNELNDAERQAILLRFFEQKSMRELGAAFGIGEDAAKMRVSRAMDRLRSVFNARGVTCGAAVLGTLLAERSVEAAPSGLVLALAGLKVPAAAAGAGVGHLLAHVSRVRLVAGAAALVIGAATVFWLVSTRNAVRPEANQGGAPNASPVLAADVGSPLAADAGSLLPAVTNANTPDPAKLLQGVVRARNRVVSGEMEFIIARYNAERSYQGTNMLKLKVQFDGNNRKVESFTREYSYVSLDPDAAKGTDALMKARGLDHEAAEREGFLKGFQSHHVAAYDGSMLLDYWENDGQPFQAMIKNPAGGSTTYLIDPRCLGIVVPLGINDTIENSLAHDSGDAIELVGQEPVGDASTWHVRTRRGSMDADFWLDTANPTRVLKHTFNGSTVFSKYDDANPRDAIPTEVTEMFLHGTQGSGTAISSTRIIRQSARFNVPVDPISWTLAGLNMKVGTSVVDYRIHRRIGYWDGTGLVDNLPRHAATNTTTTTTQAQPDRASLMALFDTQADSPAALDAAQWILLNTPDGPDVEKAATVIEQEHIEDTNLLHLALELERIRHRCATNLLRAMMEKNPSADVRGNACFGLATLLKDKSNYGSNGLAKAAAEKLFERATTEFGQVTRDGEKLAALAKPELYDLRTLSIGMPAPETEGPDLDGHRIRLSDYRGKTVVLIFWADCCSPDIRMLREAIARAGEEPLAVLGVYCDKDTAKARGIAETNSMTWPSFNDGRSGPVSTVWHNNSWPTFTIVDDKGIIRFRELSQVELQGVVEKLFAK